MVNFGLAQEKDYWCCTAFDLVPAMNFKKMTGIGHKRWR
jgi:hypothetical protein